MWTASSDVLTTDLGDELVLMHAGQGEMFSLNDSGRLLWSRLPASAEELSAHLSTAYELNEAQARSDVAAWLSALEQRGLIAAS